MLFLDIFVVIIIDAFIIVGVVVLVKVLVLVVVASVDVGCHYYNYSLWLCYKWKGPSSPIQHNGTESLSCIERGVQQKQLLSGLISNYIEQHVDATESHIQELASQVIPNLIFTGRFTGICLLFQFVLNCNKHFRFPVKPRHEW